MHEVGGSLTLIGRKLLRLVTTLWAVSVLTFLLTSLLPGDPAVTILGADGVTKESLAAVHRQLGLDKPWVTRYFSWLGHVVHGSLGFSFSLNLSVGSQIKSHLPVTLEIIVLALAISLLVGIPLGIFTAYRPTGMLSRAMSVITFVMLSVPTFVVGVLLVLLLAVNSHVFPASGWVALTSNPLENLRTAALPAITLSLPQIAVFSRLLRGDLLNTLDQDFVRFADAKGLSTSRILFGHALRPSSFSLVTVAGLQVGFLIGGSVVVETIFNVPGVGQLLVNAIYSRDLFMVQGVTLFVAAGFVVVNFGVDALYSVLDPRIRRSHVAATA